MGSWQVAELCERIGAVQPKALFGHALTGSMFVDMLRSYVAALNSGAIPEIHSVWQAPLPTPIPQYPSVFSSLCACLRACLPVRPPACVHACMFGVQILIGSWPF